MKKLSVFCMAMLLLISMTTVSFAEVEYGFVDLSKPNDSVYELKSTSELERAIQSGTSQSEVMKSADPEVVKEYVSNNFDVLVNEYEKVSDELMDSSESNKSFEAIESDVVKNSTELKCVDMRADLSDDSHTIITELKLNNGAMLTVTETDEPEKETFAVATVVNKRYGDRKYTAKYTYVPAKGWPEVVLRGCIGYNIVATKYITGRYCNTTDTHGNTVAYQQSKVKVNSTTWLKKERNTSYVSFRARYTITLVDCIKNADYFEYRKQMVVKVKPVKWYNSDADLDQSRTISTWD